MSKQEYSPPVSDTCRVGSSFILPDGFCSASSPLQIRYSRRASRVMDCLECRPTRGAWLDISGTPHYDEVVYFNSLDGVFGNEGIMTHSDKDGNLMGRQNGMLEMCPFDEY